MLDVLGNKAGSVFRSGSVPLTRPLSSGKQSYDTIPIEWPLTQPMTKVEAINQVGLFYVPLKKHHGMLLPNVGLLIRLASNKNWNSLLGSKLLSHCETCGRGDRTSLSLFTCMWVSLCFCGFVCKAVSVSNWKACEQNWEKNYGILELSNFANFFNVVLNQTFPNISVHGCIIIFVLQ